VKTSINLMKLIPLVYINLLESAKLLRDKLVSRKCRKVSMKNGVIVLFPLPYLYPPTVTITKVNSKTNRLKSDMISTYYYSMHTFLSFSKNSPQNYLLLQLPNYLKSS